jgi:hypothetical protein
VTSPGYLRYPHITNEIVVFVAADDVWLAPLAGGRAWRFTTDEAHAATPRLAPDGTQVAWVSAKDGGSEVYAASLANGTSTRLTYWGTSAGDRGKARAGSPAAPARGATSRRAHQAVQAPAAAAAASLDRPGRAGPAPKARTCYLVGSGGSIARITNGTIVTPQHSPAHSDLYGIGCAGPGTCYAIGDDGTILALS